MTDVREIDRIVTAALDEDAPWGDLTSETLIPASATAAAELVAREPGPPDCESRDALAAVRGEIEQLPPRQREVFDLRMNHGLSHAEIARLLGITEESSRANHYQALRRLRARFPEEGR